MDIASTCISYEYVYGIYRYYPLVVFLFGIVVETHWCAIYFSGYTCECTLWYPPENLQVIKATRKHAEPLAGSISYETLDDTKFIPYSERDISGEFTLFVGECV